MSALLRRTCYLIAGALIGATAMPASAGYQSVFQKNSDSPGGLPWDGSLDSNVQTAISSFTAATTVLGKHEYEAPSATTGFSYTGGTAEVQSVDGKPLPVVLDGEVVGGNNSGRYSTTQPPPTDGGNPLLGHWMETNKSFDYKFTQAVSAFSFFATDLGDFDGTLMIELYAVGNTTTAAWSSENLIGGGKDGLLGYFGVWSDSGDLFDRVRFVIKQNQTGDPDYVGFDSLVVGTGNIGEPPNDTPEPISLALVGMSLMAAGAASRRRRAG